MRRPKFCKRYKYNGIENLVKNLFVNNFSIMPNIKLKIFIAIIIAILAGSAVYYLGRLGGVEKKTSEPGFYKNDQYGFSFSYPGEGFNVSDFTDSGGKIILVKNAASDNGFQIFIIAFDEPGVMTKERILRDIPDMAISGDEYVNIGGEKALSFVSQDDLGGKTREIWLVRGGWLYRIKAYESFEKQMMEILDTWKF